MTVHQTDTPRQARGFLGEYMDTLSMVERLHRLLLDVIKDEFERLGLLDINAVQALLLFNIGEHEVTAGELKSRGYYQGSNVSYNLKKLVDAGYMHHHGRVCSKFKVSMFTPLSMFSKLPTVVTPEGNNCAISEA